jgi:hypothetical protein
MASPNNKEIKTQSEEQKEFLDPATTVAVGTFGWFALKAVVQTIIGWIGLNWYLKIRNWITRKKGKDDDKETSEEISTEESAAAS